MEYIKTYQSFKRTIAQAASSLDQTSQNATETKKIVQTIDTYFRQQILPTTSEVAALYAIQVEINKQLRLLKTDCLFLQSAKQVEKQQQRLAQITDRLTRLQQYCDMAIATATTQSTTEA